MDLSSPVAPECELDLAAAFAAPNDERGAVVVEGAGFARHRRSTAGTWDTQIDRFACTEASCAFLRLTAGQAERASIALAGGFRVEGVPAGGWLLLPTVGEGPVYWIPVAPKLRRLDADGHIVEEREPSLHGLDAGAERLSAVFSVEPGFCLDVTVWRFERGAAGHANDLRQLATLEAQPLFMWSSHTNYSGPAHVYAHLVFGHVYENHTVWPRYWKVCSELDAWALYVSMLGLERATGKRVYALMKLQLVCSVMARQASDGGWHHGEWTDRMESHFRLVAAAMQLLCAAYEESACPAILTALRRAAAFVASYAATIDAGTWFPHDSLERNEASIQAYPLRWARSTALGKSVSNMLVLNTHLDTTIAMDRYREATGDADRTGLVGSAVKSARALLRLRTAETLYRLIFWAIELTFLPTSRARALPLRLRAVKRVAWKYLIPHLHQIKARLPRFAMPGGFIDRALVQEGCVVRYHPVNLMDLARFERRFGEVADVLAGAFAFTGRSGLQQRWKEARGTEDDSLGFWSEALYHRALQSPSQELRAWLAEGVIDLCDNSLGLSPSLLGSNPEALRPGEQWPCPSPIHHALRVVNLSQGDTGEILLINPTHEKIDVTWDRPPERPVSWVTPSGAALDSTSPTVPARSWVWGRSHENARTSTRLEGRA